MIFRFKDKDLTWFTHWPCLCLCKDLVEGDFPFYVAMIPRIDHTVLQLEWNGDLQNENILPTTTSIISTR